MTPETAAQSRAVSDRTLSGTPVEYAVRDRHTGTVLAAAGDPHFGIERTDGLPGADSDLTVLRQAFCHDGHDPLGLYFGATSGELFG